MASQIDPQLHFLLVPLMSQSHLIPFTDMAKLLANHGVSVTIVMTPLNAARFSAILDHAISSNLKIQFITFPFPCKEAGLPDRCENMDALPSPDFVTQFFDATNMLQEPLERWLAALDSKPNCLISDICLPWTADIASVFSIPRMVFHTVSCFTLVCSHNITRNKIGDTVASDSESFLVPDIPDRVEFTKAQLPQYMKGSPDDLQSLLDKFKAAELSAQGAVVHTFEELEPMYVKKYQKRVKNIWCIGPLSLCTKVNKSKNKTSVYEHQCFKWLDLKKQSSVLYVCFGSLCNLHPQQLMEIGFALEASNHPFIWVIKKADYSTELEKWLVGERFEEMLKGRGLIIRGWAPQVQILSHPAVGGFLTHCGWNSTLEGVCAGVPMVTWPMFAEQFYNEKLIVQVLKIGVRVGVEVCMQWGEDEKVRVLVKRENIKRAVCNLMEEGEKGEERRRRARELGEIANGAVDSGGSSFMNTTLLIRHVMQQFLTLSMVG